jgi:hypothetical protein
MNNERAAEILTIEAERHDAYAHDHHEACRPEEGDACEAGASALLAVSRLEAEREELVEALSTICENYVDDVDPPHWDRDDIKALDLLVKHGRVTKNGERYEWRKP